MLPREFNDQLAESVSRLQVVRYMTVVSMALLVIEWLFLFADEVELIWKSKWTFIKVLYIISRYMPFVDTVMIVIYNVKVNVNPEFCSMNDQVSLWFASTGLAISELILLWRTYAIWNNSKKVLGFMGLIWIIWVTANVLIFVRMAPTIEFDTRMVPGNPGCHVVAGGGKVAVLASYLTLVGYEAIIVAMTLYKGIEHIKDARDPVIKTLYRDGILFFLILLSLCLANVIQLVVAPIEYLDVLDNFISVVHRVLCCRILLNLRGAAQRGMPTFQVTCELQNLSSVRFDEPQDNAVVAPHITAEDGTVTPHSRSQATTIETNYEP